jgi:hypothetical protein
VKVIVNKEWEEQFYTRKKEGHVLEIAKNS